MNKQCYLFKPSEEELLSFSSLEDEISFLWNDCALEKDVSGRGDEEASIREELAATGVVVVLTRKSIAVSCKYSLSRIMELTAAVAIWKRIWRCKTSILPICDRMSHL